MILQLRRGTDVAQTMPRVRAGLSRWLRKSRFTAIVEPTDKLYRLKISQVRLREYKDYCGQHPGPCVLGGARHRHSRYLEGADWVGFNDGLNTVLDLLNAAADVWSYNREAIGSRYYIRRGYERLVNYAATASGGQFNQAWLQPVDADFADYRRCPHRRSVFPYGTPGIATWRVVAARRAFV